MRPRDTIRLDFALEMHEHFVAKTNKTREINNHVKFEEIMNTYLNLEELEAKAQDDDNNS